MIERDKQKKKQVTIGFTGFWKGFDPNNNYFLDILKKYYEVRISDDPDYLFCSVFNNRFIYNEKAVRILYTGEYQIPDFNLFDYAMGFDYISFEDRYCRVPLYLLYDSSLLEKALKRGGMRNKPVYRDKFCSFVYSNKRADPIREEFFKRLNKVKNVESGGGYLNNIGYKVNDKIDFESQFRFSMAFENSAYPGYITEKVLQGFAAGTIPIYWGDLRANLTLNPNAYINLNECVSIDEAISLITEIDNDRERFLSMLSAKPFVSDSMMSDQKKECEAFLKHIFDMPLEESFRRNRSMWGNNYALFIKRYTKVNEKLRKFKDIFRK